MRTATVLHRGEKVEVSYRDHGYEADTNAHDIDWEFTDPTLNADLTDEEQDAIYLQLVEASFYHERGCE